MPRADYALSGIKAYCGVKTWFNKNNSVRRLKLFGLKADVEMARYLYEMIAGVITVETVRWQRTDDYQLAFSRRSATSSFKLGMANRISERLKQMARDLEPIAKTATGTALVVVKSAAVAAAYANLNLHLSSMRMDARIRDGNGYHAGQAAGNRVNLSRPVGGAQRQLAR